METPTIQRKKGKTRSVKVQPCQTAWRRGGKTWLQEPGLFTITMAAIVKPRKTSSDSSRGILLSLAFFFCEVG